MRAFVVLFCTIAMPGLIHAQSVKTDAARTTPMSGTARPAVSLSPMVNEDQVNGWIRKWQKRLALEDWFIEAKVVRIWDLPENAVANVHWSIPTRKATVKVLNSVDSNLKRSEIVTDTELSVVHELIHLSMAKLPLDPNHTELEEETVKKISTALLALEQKR